MQRRAWALFALALLCLTDLACGKTTPRAEIMIAAAASLRGVMPELMAGFAKTHEGVRLTVTYGASGDLRQQVEGGAPIDVLVLASGSPIDQLVRGRLAEGASRKVVATNQLVMIGPKGAKRFSFATIDTVPPSEKIAIGDPKTVPAGQYAQAALQKLGKWDAIQGHLVFAGDVSGVLVFVRRGEVAAGIVYKTEIHGVTDVDVLDELAADVGPRPEVVAAVTTGSRVPADAKGFVEFLGSAGPQKTFTDYGFGAP